MLDRLREAFLRQMPQGVRQALPSGDRRRGAQWGMVAVGVFMIAMGRFAAFSPVDTLFTQVLTRLGMETEWGVVMILNGIALVVTAFIPWRAALVAVYGTSGLTLCWTWILVGWIGRLNTPTVDVCLGVGVVMLIAAVSKARQSVCVRAFQRTQNGYSRR